MKHIRNIFFDLDGTLTDPAEGITRCIQYALESLNLPCPSAEGLALHIGPPLRQTFAAICESSDGALIEKAVALYRERFAAVGLYENHVYDGVEEMLAALRSLSYNLFVATSKPRQYAERIVEHFSLVGYFIEIHGNELSGRLDDKAQLLSELIEKHQIDPYQALMVGDRKHDVVAARSNGVRSLGVTYGYGSKEELMRAGADDICAHPMEVVSYLSGIEDKRSGKDSPRLERN